MRLFCIAITLLTALTVTAHAAKIIPNGSNSQSITVVIKDAAGAPVTGIDVTNLDLYCVRDGDQISAKVDITALASDHAAWGSGKAFEIGLGLYRVDIPDANLSDGIGQMLTYVIDDAVGTNVTTFYEVQLSGPTQTADVGVRIPQVLTFSSVGGTQMPQVTTNAINGTSIAGTGSRIADAFIAMFNIATPVFTVASVNQTGNSYDIVNHATYGNSALHTDIATTITNTTAVVGRYLAR